MKTSILTGMSEAALRATLNEAQQAYIAMSLGSHGVSFSYTQGDGSKSVTYRSGNISELAALIRMLQLELGIIPNARRPITFRF